MLVEHFNCDIFFALWKFNKLVLTLQATFLKKKLITFSVSITGAHILSYGIWLKNIYNLKIIEMFLNDIVVILLKHNNVQFIYIIL